ncbi:MAG TPA: hypothetical protein VNK91_12420 [Burkholderiaceae bacterium]|jgi:hypothetical protein|nr:hypothetical protein [Burkholderiaceae bacterium]
MKKVLKPTWSKEQVAAGARSFERWDAFFSGRAADGTRDAAPTAADARIAEVRARHEAELLRYPNVVAIAEGWRTRRGTPTGERCLVVYVQRKVPARQLAAGARLPKQIEGVPIDVVEVGGIATLPA